MSKPLNSSVQILHANASVTGNYTEAFNVTKSLTFLLIARDETFALQLTDPKGKIVVENRLRVMNFVKIL